jgi:hypothetical protein
MPDIILPSYLIIIELLLVLILSNVSYFHLNIQNAGIYQGRLSLILGQHP